MELPPVGGSSSPDLELLPPMSADRRRPVAAVLALLGALLVAIAVIGTAVHYAAQPDAAVGTPPGSSAWDRVEAGAGREGADLLDRVAGREPETRVVAAPMPEQTFGADAADTYDGSVDTAAAAASLSGRPDRLEAPSRGISVGYAPSQAVDGALVLPEAPGTVWYDQSAPIGEPGASLIAGHVNYSDLSLSPFSQIAGLEKGAPILVTDDGGAVHEYAVESLQVYEQQALPEDLLQTAGQDELVLVTCSGDSISTGGAWSYEYNLVVTARAV